LDGERVFKLYDAIKASKGKVAPRPEDLTFIVRTAAQLKTDPTKDEAERKKSLAEFEELARDLSTQLHLLAQHQEQQKLYLDSAEAYKIYLSLFRPEKYVRAIMQNRADALFAAHSYPAAARQFEELARYEDKAKDSKALETALYGALLSHFSALKPGEVEKISAFEVADARQALKLLGARYVSRFPRNEHVLEIKFNIARAYYDDGEFDKSAELFTKFALDNPDNKDATTAGHLALDSLRQRYDFKALEETGRKFIASRLPVAFVEEVRKIVNQSRAEALDELALRSSAETGDVIEGLLKVASENKGAELGEKALYGAFTAARDKRDLAKEKELALKLSQDYPKSQFLSNVILTLGRHEAEAARFSDAAAHYELVGQKLKGDATALDGWLAAARLRMAMGNYKEAIHDLETAADIGGSRKVEVLTLLAQLRLKTKEPAKAKATAQEVLKLNRTNAAAAAVLAEVASNQGGQPSELTSVLTAVTNGPEGQSEDSAKALWYLGEEMYRNFRAVPADQLEQKVAALQGLVGIYTQSAGMGSSEWAVASLWKLGMAYQNIADAVEATPVPKGLSAAEVQQFRNAVKEQVSPLKDQADDAFKTCLTRATQLEVFSPAVVGCRSRTDTPKVTMPTAGAPLAGPANLAELQKKVETTLDAASLEALGLAYLESRQLGMAQLT
jgi:tetratricopeptide (TPR) repeat protein